MSSLGTIYLPSGGHSISIYLMLILSSLCSELSECICSGLLEIVLKGLDGDQHLIQILLLARVSLQKRF